MFASDDEGPSKVAPEASTHDKGMDMAQMPEPVMPAAAGGSVEYGKWPVKELRRFLQERGVNVAGIVEKEELVSKVKEVCATLRHVCTLGMFVFDTGRSGGFRGAGCTAGVCFRRCQWLLCQYRDEAVLSPWYCDVLQRQQVVSVGRIPIRTCNVVFCNPIPSIQCRGAACKKSQSCSRAANHCNATVLT